MSCGTGAELFNGIDSTSHSRMKFLSGSASTDIVLTDRTFFTRIVSYPIVEEWRPDGRVDDRRGNLIFEWRCTSVYHLGSLWYDGPKYSIIPQNSPVSFENVLNLFVLCWKPGKKWPFKIIIALTLWFISQQRSSVSTVMRSLLTSAWLYPLSRNLSLRMLAWDLKVEMSVQFLRKRRNWLLGTKLSHDLWWQLSVGINPFLSVALKWVLNINCCSDLSITRSRKLILEGLDW